MQRVGIHTTGQNLAGGGHHVVVGTGQAGDGVQQDHHVFFQFHQALGALDDHFGHVHVACGRLVKGGGNDFALDGALHFGHFFWALVDQQHHQIALGVIGRDGVGNVLHHHRLAALGLGHDQCALAFADGCNDVDDAAGDVFFALDVLLQAHLHLGEERCQVLEHHLVLVLFGATAVDLVELVQCKVTLAVLGRTHFAFDHVAGVQVEAAHLAGADVDVVGTGRVAGIGAAQKAKAVGQNFQHAIGNDLLTRAGALFDDGKHQLLLAHTAGVFDLKLFSLLEDFRHVQCLEFV